MAARAGCTGRGEPPPRPRALILAETPGLPLGYSSNRGVWAADLTGAVRILDAQVGTAAVRAAGGVAGAQEKRQQHQVRVMG